MKNLFPLVILLFIFSSCGKDDTPSPMLSSTKSISSFVISGIEGIINESTKTVNLNLSSSANLTSLIPTINISPKAKVKPASEVAQDFTNPITYTITAEDGSTTDYLVSVFNECVSSNQIHAFTYDGKNYELISLNRDWALAAACAVERGGYLAEINSAGENNALFDEVTQVANVDPNTTVALDGGDAGYVWLGGTDVTTEGEWYWDGNNDGIQIHFWQGNYSGSPIDDRYTNWGDEPDNFTGQDGLGLAITQWPINSGSLGSPGQWNDIKLSNELYYIIEFD